MSKKSNVLTKEEELKRFDILLDSDPKRMSPKERQFFSKEAQKLLVKKPLFNLDDGPIKDN